MYLYNRMHEVFIKMSVYCFVVAPPSSLYLRYVQCLWPSVCVCLFVDVFVLVASNNKLFKL